MPAFPPPKKFRAQLHLVENPKPPESRSYGIIPLTVILEKREWVPQRWDPFIPSAKRRAMSPC
jgi:hypothetical protein